MLICDDETGHGSSACLAFCFSFVHFLGPTIMVIMIITTCHIILVTSVTKDDIALFDLTSLLRSQISFALSSSTTFDITVIDILVATIIILAHFKS